MQLTIGLLILRLTVGLTLPAPGSQKLFGWFGGPGLNGTGQFVEMLGFRPGRPKRSWHVSRRLPAVFRSCCVP